MNEAETAVLKLVAERASNHWSRISSSMVFGINPSPERLDAFRLGAANLELRGMIERSSPAGGPLTHARLTDHGRRWLLAERQVKSDPFSVPLTQER